MRRRIPGIQVICDPSHMAGRSDLVPLLAQMALDMKADGLFIEVHPDPAKALSDQKQQLTPQQFRLFLKAGGHIRVLREYKKDHNLAILQSDRYKAISDTLTGKGKELGLDEDFIRLLFETIHAESIRCQINKKNTI